MKWLELILAAVEIVAKAVAEGASDEEIAERLSAPGTVGAHLLASVDSRKARRKAYAEGGKG
jgi:DNA-binding NarL/FixJ family response regulator